MTTLEITNFRRIKSASLELGGITLLCGENGAGKTSCVQALRMMISNDTTVVDGLLKRDAIKLVHNGEKMGSVILGDAAAKVTKAGIELAGAERIASQIATGAVPFMGMNKKDQLKMLFTIFKAEPDYKQFSETLTTTINWKGAAPAKIEATLQNIWKKIEADGWDEAAKEVQGMARLRKQQWTEQTGEEWGATKGDTWVPAGQPLSLFVVAGGDKISAKEDETTKAYNLAAARRAVNIENATGLQRLIDTLPELASQKTATTKDRDEKQTQLQSIQAEKLEIERAQRDANSALTCPNKECGSKLKVHDGKLVFSAAVSSADVQKRDLRHKVVSANEITLRNEIKQLNDGLAEIEADMREAENAERKLATTTTGTYSIEQVAAAETAMKEAQAAAVAYKKWALAQQAHAGAVNYIAVGKELGEGGIRQRNLDAALGKFNNKLAEYAVTMEMQPVSLTSDMDVALGGMQYNLLSSATQYTVNLLLQLAIAQFDGSEFLIIDGADAIQYPGRREKLLLTLQNTGLPCLLTMAYSNVADAPDLIKHGFGKTYCINDGTTFLVREE